MPKVKQVDFDLNAINNELTGESSDLHREIMPNLIDSGTYVGELPFRIMVQPSGYAGPKEVGFNFKVIAQGDNITYQWQYKDPLKDNVWKNFTAGNFDKPTFLRVLTEYYNNRLVRCILTQKDKKLITYPVEIKLT